MSLYSASGALNVAPSDTTGKGVFAANGSLRITVVSGGTRTGLYAADGSYNVVSVSSSDVSPFGVYHPCGALRGIAWSSGGGLYSGNGAILMNGLYSFTAPTLAFASATDPDSDNTQDFTADFTVSILGKTVRLVGTFGSATVGAFDVDSSNTVDAGEDAALQVAFTTGVIPDGLCAFKCRIEDGSGNALSNWSNTVSKTIIPSYRGTYYYLGF